MALYCPFCSEPITPETTTCPSCDHKYTSDTLSFIKRSQEGQVEYLHEKRKHTRYRVKLKVVFLSPQDFADHYIFDLSKGGVFVQSKSPLPRGEEVLLEISFLDKTKPMEILGEVRWSRKTASRTSKGRRLPPGMGVEFLKLSAEYLERLVDVLNRALD